MVSFFFCSSAPNSFSLFASNLLFLIRDQTFCLKTTKNCIFFFRLSYHQRVVDSVPGSFRGFAPDKPDPTFKYEALPETENNMTCMISAKLVNAIKAKCAPEEIQAILKEVPDDEGSDQATCLRVSQDSIHSLCTIFHLFPFLFAEFYFCANSFEHGKQELFTLFCCHRQVSSHVKGELH